MSHAKEIEYQMEALKNTYSNVTDHGVSLKISVPRASYISEVFAEYATTLVNEENLRIYYHETNSMKTIQDVLDFITTSVSLDIIQCMRVTIYRF